jgi:hypothetical protein
MSEAILGYSQALMSISSMAQRKRRQASDSWNFPEVSIFYINDQSCVADILAATEIRSEVYSYLVIFPGKRRLGWTKPPAITQTSQLVRQESLSIFYSHNMWIYRPLGGNETKALCHFETAMAVVARPYIPFLHNLEIQLCYCVNHGSSSLLCKLDPFPDAVVTLKWAEVTCEASERRRQRVLRHIHRVFDEKKLSGDMERTIHFGKIPLCKIFKLIRAFDMDVHHPLTYSCV